MVNHGKANNCGSPEVGSSWIGKFSGGSHFDGHQEAASNVDCCFNLRHEEWLGLLRQGIVKCGYPNNWGRDTMGHSWISSVRELI